MHQVQNGIGANADAANPVRAGWNFNGSASLAENFIKCFLECGSLQALAVRNCSGLQNGDFVAHKNTSVDGLIFEVSDGTASEM